MEFSFTRLRRASSGRHHFRLALVSVAWKTLDADMRFSMYWPRTWFSDFNLRFSSLTASTRADRSGRSKDNGQKRRGNTVVS